FEKRGLFNQAMALWELVRSAAPHDLEARDKAKDLAANATIARGRYEAVVAGGGAEEAAAEPDDDAVAEEPDGDEALVAAPAPVPDRRSQAIVRLRAQIDNDPTLPTPYLTLATFHRRLGQLDEARAVLEEGLGPTGRAFDLMTELAELEIEPFRHNLVL